jgi:hypothetical protein
VVCRDEKGLPVEDSRTSSPPGWSSKNLVTSYTYSTEKQRTGEVVWKMDNYLMISQNSNIDERERL